MSLTKQGKRQLTWMQREYIFNTQPGGPLAYVSGETLAKTLGVSAATISKIRDGSRYKSPKPGEVEVPAMYYKVLPTFKCRVPPQWKAFIAREGRHVTPLSHEVEPLGFTHMSALRRVNEYVNWCIKYTADPEGNDNWQEFQIFDKDILEILQGSNLSFTSVKKYYEGDCEEYVFTKRRALAPWLGYGALSPCIMDFSRTTKHMVLTVHCQDQTLILDNFTDNILQLSKHHKPLSIYRNGDWNYAITYTPRDTKKAQSNDKEPE